MEGQRGEIWGGSELRNVIRSGKFQGEHSILQLHVRLTEDGSGTDLHGISFPCHVALGNLRESLQRSRWRTITASYGIVYTDPCAQQGVTYTDGICDMSSQENSSTVFSINHVYLSFLSLAKIIPLLSTHLFFFYMQSG